MNASSFITFSTYMLRQNVIPFWKELFVVFKIAPNIKKRSLYFSSYRRLYYTEVFLKQIAIHVLVHVRIYTHYHKSNLIWRTVSRRVDEVIPSDHSRRVASRVIQWYGLIHET